MDTEPTDLKRPLEETSTGGEDVPVKRVKLDEPATDAAVSVVDEPSASKPETAETAESAGTADAPELPPRKVLHPNPLPVPVSKLGLKPKMPELPPSLALVTGITPDFIARNGIVGEKEVGIIGYAGPKNVVGVRGVIKQR